jgi:uncharacterized protein (TIGR02117 family)
MTLRKFFIIGLKIIGMILLLVGLYIVVAIGLSYTSVNSDFKQCEKDAVAIYILTNGVHTDLVLPINNEFKDWRNFVHPSDTRSGSVAATNVAFGWGDKGFYLQTKTWADLKFKTAFNAMFYLSSSAMHVTFYTDMEESESCRKICVNKTSYLKLVEYICKTFEKDRLGNPILIKAAAYGHNDLFYEANGSYGLFTTCNTWTNNGLKAADLKACWWTPFDKGMFHHYRN